MARSATALAGCGPNAAPHGRCAAGPRCGWPRRRCTAPLRSRRGSRPPAPRRSATSVMTMVIAPTCAATRQQQRSSVVSRSPSTNEALLRLGALRGRTRWRARRVEHSGRLGLALAAVRRTAATMLPISRPVLIGAPAATSAPALHQLGLVDLVIVSEQVQHAPREAKFVIEVLDDGPGLRSRCLRPRSWRDDDVADHRRLARVGAIGGNDSTSSACPCRGVRS